jgi:putative endonuclease
MHYTYLIKSIKEKWVYVGSTSDLVKRIEKHNKGLVKSTKYYKPFNLVYYEAYRTLSQARKREFEIKNNSQQKEIILKRIGLT